MPRKSQKSIPQIEPFYGEGERKAVDKYLRSGGWLTEHTKTREFEDAIAQFIGVSHAIAVPSGTAGLYLAIKALGITGEVIVPDFTMVASANAVEMAGAKPVFVDITLGDFCLDLDALPITKETQAILVVHLNGKSPDMQRLKAMCFEKGLKLIEDACQAFGSEWNGRKLGTFGDVAIVSFSPHKIITTGQGGMVLTNRAEVNNKVRRLKDFGRLEGGEDVYPEIGYNFKFTDLQAVFGLEQMKTIEWRIEKKKEIYFWYFGEIPSYLPWFIYGFSEKRAEFMDELKRAGIGTRKFYPPVHTLYGNGDFPKTEYVSQQGFWLPSSLSLTREDIERICDLL